MSWWILDTDHVSLLLTQHPQVSHYVMERGENVAITIVTVQELFNGWVVRINAATDLNEVIRFYGQLSRTITLCKRVPILEFDQRAGNCYQQLLQATPSLAKKRLQKDMRIAAIALVNGATLVTRNHRDFGQVPALFLENWTTTD